MHLVRTLTRKSFLAGVGGAAAGGAGIGLVGGIASARTAPSPEQDRRILTFLLGLQALESAFYAEARRGGALTGDLADYVHDVAADERRHGEALSSALGGTLAPASATSFPARDAFRDPAAFARTASALEDAVVAAMNGQATNLTPGRLAVVLSIVSVEARHAAWIRELAGIAPAAEAADVPSDPDAVRAALRRAGLPA